MQYTVLLQRKKIALQRCSVLLLQKKKAAYY